MHLISRLMIRMLGFVTPLLGLPKPFSFVGPDSSLSMCREIIGLGVKRLMIITDGPLMKLGIANAIIETLRNAGVTVEVFSEIEPDPGYELV